MKVYRKRTPRNFLVSKKNNIYLKDVGKVNLGINENLTFTSSGSKKYEVCRKDWGYYATPSINSRLKKNGFKTALAKQKKKYFILLVDKKKISKFKTYCRIENYKIIKWLDKLP